MERRDIVSGPSVDAYALTPVSTQPDEAPCTARAGSTAPTPGASAGFFHRLPALLAQTANPDPSRLRMRTLDSVRAAMALLPSAVRTHAERTPTASTASSIGKLPPELWTAIAGQLDVNDRKAFRLACWAGYRSAVPSRLVIHSASGLAQLLATFDPAQVHAISLRDGTFDARALCTLPNTLQELTLGYVNTSIDALYEALPRLDQLCKLCIEGPYDQRAHDQHAHDLTLAIAPCAALTDVTFDRCGIGDFGAIKLAGNSRLRTVSLFMNGITDAGAIRLAKHASLRNLALISEPGITDQSAMWLAQRPFDSLNLRHCAIGDAGALVLVNRRRVKHLNLSGNPLSDACRRTLAERAKAYGITLIL
jgi:hypothetical protein